MFKRKEAKLIQVFAMIVFLAVVTVSVKAFAKYESSSEDVKPVVLYGNYLGNILPLKVDVNGVIQTN